jgi:hypothetical protein
MPVLYIHTYTHTHTHIHTYIHTHTHTNSVLGRPDNAEWVETHIKPKPMPVYTPPSIYMNLVDPSDGYMLKKGQKLVVKYHMEISVSRQRADDISREVKTANDGCAALVEVSPGCSLDTCGYDRGADNNHVDGKIMTQNQNLDQTAGERHERTQNQNMDQSSGTQNQNMGQSSGTQNQDGNAHVIDVRVLIDGEEVVIKSTRRGKPIGNWDTQGMNGMYKIHPYIHAHTASYTHIHTIHNQ